MTLSVSYCSSLEELAREEGRGGISPASEQVTLPSSQLAENNSSMESPV